MYITMSRLVVFQLEKTHIRGICVQSHDLSLATTHEYITDMCEWRFHAYRRISVRPLIEEELQLEDNNKDHYAKAK